MNTKYEEKDKLLIFEITEEIDHHTTEKMRRKMDNEIERYMPKKILFDFDKVSFMDSAGIGLIMGRYKKVNGKGEIYITGAGDSIKRILLISGLHKLVVDCVDVNEAVWRIKQGKEGVSL